MGQRARVTAGTVGLSMTASYPHRRCFVSSEFLVLQFATQTASVQITQLLGLLGLVQLNPSAGTADL